MFDGEFREHFSPGDPRASINLHHNRIDMSRRFLTVLVLLFTFCIASTALPQEPGPPPPGQDETSPNQEPTIRVGVDLVNILFSGSHEKGRQLIPNLEKKNFHGIMRTEKSRPFSTSRAKPICR